MYETSKMFHLKLFSQMKAMFLVIMNVHLLFGYSKVSVMDIISADIIDDALNTSNHSPVFIIIKCHLPVSNVDCKHTDKHDGYNGKIAWHKVELDDNMKYMYQSELDRIIEGFPDRSVYNCFDPLCDCEEHCNEIDHLCEDLINCCLKADKVFPRCSNFKSCKPGWTENVAPYKKECSFWYSLWCQAGKPTSGDVYSYLREAKHQYLYAVRCIKRRENDLRKEKLLENISTNNTRDLFKEVKKINSSRQQPTAINKLTDRGEIAEHFAVKYKELYNCAQNDPVIMERITDYINSDLNNNLQVNDMMVSVDMVIDAVKNLNHRKGDGDTTFSSSHLIYSSQKYFSQLAKLFTAMLVHGHQPNALLLATIISIPKATGVILQVTLIIGALPYHQV
jgi:hypothetical protein